MPIVTLTWLAADPARASGWNTTAVAPDVGATMRSDIQSSGRDASWPSSDARIGGLDLARTLPWLSVLWACGVGCCAVRLAGGWFQTRRLLRRDTTEPDGEWSALVSELSSRIGVHRAVRVLASARIDVPVVVGAVVPVLLLPVSALSGLTPRQVEAVIAHELAHIRRHDYLINLVQSSVECVLFYHPAVWWVSHVIRVEREHCCDDLAVPGVRRSADVRASAHEYGSAPTRRRRDGDGCQRRVPALPCAPSRGRTSAGPSGFVGLGPGSPDRADGRGCRRHQLGQWVGNRPA